MPCSKELQRMVGGSLLSGPMSSGGRDRQPCAPGLLALTCQFMTPEPAFLQEKKSMRPVDETTFKSGIQQLHLLMLLCVYLYVISTPSSKHGIRRKPWILPHDVKFNSRQMGSS